MKHITIGSIACTCALLGACASNEPRPTEAMTRAENSVNQADQAGARRYDPANLDSAQQKLSQARTAADKGDEAQANRLAQQAELDAELAAAKARSAESRKAAEEVRASTEALRSESQRQSSVPPSATPSTPVIPPATAP